MSLHQEIPYAQINKPVPKPVIEPMDAPSCEAVQNERRWWIYALAGIALGVLVVAGIGGMLG